MAIGHWNKEWEQFRPRAIDPSELKNAPEVSDRAFIAAIGDVAGMRVLDLGCGNGELSVYLAKSGAEVTAVDESAQAVKNVQELALFNGVDDKVTAEQSDIRALKAGGKYDVVVGRFILHHLEPFKDIPVLLSNLIKNSGRGVFLENNSRNPLLMVSRNYLAGRFGIPKHSDGHEYPLEPREVATLETEFKTRVEYPGFMFFSLLCPYLFPGGSGILGKLLPRLDQAIHDYVPPLRRYGYFQVIELCKK